MDRLNKAIFSKTRTEPHKVIVMWCICFFCIYVYFGRLPAVPRYLNINMIFGIGNMTSRQNMTKNNASNLAVKKNVVRVFRNHSYCQIQRRIQQQSNTHNGNRTGPAIAPQIQNSNKTGPATAQQIQNNNKTRHATAPQIQNSNETGSATAPQIQNKSKVLAPENSSSIYSSCPDLHKPDMKRETQTFQPVNQQVFVFSAYYDHRPPEPTIKVIAASNVHHRDELLHCQLWFNESCEPHIKQVSSVEKHAHFPGLQSFTAKLLSCVLPDNRVPYMVSIVENRCRPLNVLPVINNYKLYKDKPKYQFTVCGPILASFNDIYSLVNMIEINSMFGAEKFVFYDYSIQEKARKYLKKYQDEGKVELINWKLPPAVRSHFRAQSNAVLECQYRNMYKSRYIAYFDTDEVLVPKSLRNWSEIISNLTDDSDPEFCGAIFRNAFFRSELPQPKLLNGSDATIANEYAIRPLLVTIRDIEIKPHGAHSKWICNPLYVTMGSVHNPQICYMNTTEYTIPLTIGFMHHYRTRPYYAWHKTQPDNFMLRHKDEILKRVVGRHKRLEPKPTTTMTTPTKNGLSSSRSLPSSTTKAPKTQNTKTNSSNHL